MTNETVAEQEVRRTVDTMAEEVAEAITTGIMDFQRTTIENLGDAMSLVARTVLHQSPTIVITELKEVRDWLQRAERDVQADPNTLSAADNFALSVQYVEGRIRKWQASQVAHEAAPTTKAEMD